MNSKKILGQIICNIIALAASLFYLILAVAYIGYMVYLVAAEVKMGIVLLVPMFIFLPVIIEGCLIPILRLIMVINSFSAKKSIKNEEPGVARKFKLASVLCVIEAVGTMQVLIVDGLVFLIAFGSKANQLLGNIDEGLAGFIFFFVLAFSLIPVVARIVTGIAFTFSNAKDSNKLQ